MITEATYNKYATAAEKRLNKRGIFFNHGGTNFYIALARELPDSALHFVMSTGPDTLEDEAEWVEEFLDEVKQEADRRVEAVLLGQPQ